MEVGRSGIPTRGLFATRHIPRGTRIIEHVGDKVTKAESPRRATIQFELGRAGGDGAVYIFTLNARWRLLAASETRIQTPPSMP